MLTVHTTAAPDNIISAKLRAIRAQRTPSVPAWQAAGYPDHDSYVRLECDAWLDEVSVWSDGAADELEDEEYEAWLDEQAEAHALEQSYYADAA